MEITIRSLRIFPRGTEWLAIAEFDNGDATLVATGVSREDVETKAKEELAHW